MADLTHEARIDLAAALRLAAHYDFSEGVCNHFSYQIPGNHERFLINPAPERDRGASALHLALNWPAMLEER